MSERVAAPSALGEVDESRWDAVLDRVGCDDVYFRHAYVRASSLLDPGPPVLLHAATDGGSVVFACILRDLPGAAGAAGARDVTTPYGYGGPFVAGDDPPVARFWSLYEDWCRRTGVVTTFVRFHPLLANHVHAPPGAHVDAVADTASWRLDDGRDLFAGLHAKHRNAVRKAERAGVRVRVETAPPTLASFADLYLGTMRGHAADAFYFFPPEYWAILERDLAARIVRFDAEIGGETVASALCLASADVRAALARSGAGRRAWLHYHLGAASARGRAVSATTLLLLEVARWARRAGYAELHLGSGVGGREDSVWRFKQRFSPPDRRVFRVGKLVHDEEAYGALGGDAEDLGGFFPAYRAAR